MQIALRFWIAAFALCAAGAASAQTFPAKSLRIVLGFPPGGAIDTIARVIAPRMAADLGQSVVVENKPGAGGVIGMQSVARAEPDGYTVFMGTKAHPGETYFSSSGNGGLPHMAGEMFNAAAGVKMTHVPYKGSAPSVNDVVAGQVQLTFEAVAAGIPHVKADRLRALATTGNQRLGVLPDVPTVAETIPGFEVTNWFGMAVPAGTPADRINRIQQSVATALRDPDVLRTFAGLGVDPVGNPPAQFGAYIAQERARWQKVITDANIRRLTDF